MRRLVECPVCGRPRCVDLGDRYYCFRFGVTRKKTQGLRKKRSRSHGSFEGGFQGGNFFKSSPPEQIRFDFEDSDFLHKKAIEEG